MASLRLRALVLAAGRGERLRPLTDVVPKPLLPAAGTEVAGHTLARLAAAGCEAAALNLHHLGGAVRDRLGDSWHGMPLTWSEEPAPLGTLGALGPLADFLAVADLVLVINGDSLCAWPIRPLVRRHVASGAAATLLFARRADPARFGGGVAVAGRRVISFGPPPSPAPSGGAPRGGPGRESIAGEQVRRRVFAGAQALSPDLLLRAAAVAAERGACDIVRDLYAPLLAEGDHLAALVTGRRWHDLGTSGRYLDAALDAARGRFPVRLWRRSWTAPGARVERGTKLSAAAVEAGATIEAGARLERTVVMPGARVAAGCRLVEAIVGPGVALPAGTHVERRLVTVAREGVAPAPDESRVGGLVYTPFDRGAQARPPRAPGEERR
jgi:mannose-1-phosphate guanylyltransferase